MSEHENKTADGRGRATFFEELKRRRVYKTAAVYGAAAFAVVEGAQATFPSLGLSEGVYDFVVICALAGFPIALVLAWIYDISKRGVELDAGPGSRRPVPAWQPVAALLVVATTVAGAAIAWAGRIDEGVQVEASIEPSGPEPPQPGSEAGEAVRPLPLDMVRVEGGEKTIGYDRGREVDGPQHTVSIPTFAIQRREVSVAEYREYAVAEGAALPWSGAGPDDDLPVTGVFWGEAVEYCRWRYRGGRLPTEQQWEAAARGPDGHVLPWGSAPSQGRANTQSAGLGAPTAVGSFPDGPSGLNDVIGNVWEWTRSQMVAYPGGSAPPDGHRYYVIRGGAYNTPDEVAHAAYRGYLPPTTQERTDFAATGFRCVIEDDEAAPTPQPR